MKHSVLLRAFNEQAHLMDGGPVNQNEGNRRKRVFEEEMTTFF